MMGPDRSATWRMQRRLLQGLRLNLKSQSRRSASPLEIYQRQKRTTDHGHETRPQLLGTLRALNDRTRPLGAMTGDLNIQVSHQNQKDQSKTPQKSIR